MEAATLTSRTHLADDPQWRESQRARLHELQQDLLAEGAVAGQYLPELQARAATWPE